MRYTIEGFSQIEAVKFRRVEIVNGKERTVTLDCTDLVILRWFVDFWPRMTKVEVDGRQYAWVSYKSLIEDMPLLGIKKRALALRLMKLADFGILSHHTVKSGGTFSYYGFGPEYARLIDDKPTSTDCNPSQLIDEGVANQLTTPSQFVDEGVVKRLTTPSQLIDVQNNSSTKDSSTKDKSTNKHKKRSDEFREAIHGFTGNNELQSAIWDFIEHRKQMKAPMSTRSLTLLLNRLNKLAPDEGTQIAILNEAIMNGWKSVYPLKTSNVREVGPNGVELLPESERDHILDGIL